MAEIDILQDCLTECTRIETARNNCITAMNSAGLSTPSDTSLGYLPHYFGCDSYVTEDLPYKVPANFDDVTAAIDNIEEKKSNLKSIINIFCAPFGNEITNQIIDEYYTYISRARSTTYQVQYITNLKRNGYINLGNNLIDTSTRMDAELSWNLSNISSTSVYSNMIFGVQIQGADPRIQGFSLIRENNSYQGSFIYIRNNLYISVNISSNNKVTFNNCYGNYTESGGLVPDITGHVYGSIDSTSYNKNLIAGDRYYTITGNTQIFNNTGNCPLNSRFYSGSLYDGNSVLQHRYIPVITWMGCNWSAGVKDTVTNRYYYPTDYTSIGFGPLIGPI